MVVVEGNVVGVDDPAEEIRTEPCAEPATSSTGGRAWSAPDSNGNDSPARRDGLAWVWRGRTGQGASGERSPWWRWRWHPQAGDRGEVSHC